MVDDTTKQAGRIDSSQTRRRFLQGVGVVGVSGRTLRDREPEKERGRGPPDEGDPGPRGPPERSDPSATPEWLQFMVEKAIPETGLTTWVPTGSFDTSSFARVDRFPRTFAGADVEELALVAARNEQASGQIAILSSDPITELSCSVGDLTAGAGEQISGDAVDVRYVGYVPIANAHSEFSWSATFEEVADDPLVTRTPDWVADPLLEVDTVGVPAYEAQPVWFTVDVPADVAPGTYEGTITVQTADQGSVEYALTVEVNDVTLPDPENYEFYLDIWMNANAIAAEHAANPTSDGVEPWSDRHWELIEAYMQDMAKRGQQSITATIIHEPWQRSWLNGIWRPQTETGYESMVKWSYDGEEWSFDFSLFDEFVKTGIEQGMGPDIAAYSMLVFRGPQRITYHDESEGDRVVWRGEAGDPFWTEAWTAFLEAFEPHLESKGWLDRTYIAFDERPAELMQEVVDLLRDVAPFFEDRLHIAGSMDVEDIAHNLAANYGHVPIDRDVIDRRRENGKITTFYTAGGASHPNTFSFSPPAEARMLPWISARNHLDGYLRWAYNSWPSDVYVDPTFRYVQGDEYFVYPGEDGPVSSIGWEQLTEGIEDYELIHALREQAGGNVGPLEDAFELATRDRDAREKNLQDIVEAKEIVLEELTGY